VGAPVRLISIFKLSSITFLCLFSDYPAAYVIYYSSASTNPLSRFFFRARARLSREWQPEKNKKLQREHCRFKVADAIIADLPAVVPRMFPESTKRFKNYLASASTISVIGNLLLVAPSSSAILPPLQNRFRPALSSLLSPALIETRDPSSCLCSSSL